MDHTCIEPKIKPTRYGLVLYDLLNRLLQTPIVSLRLYGGHPICGISDDECRRRHCVDDIDNI